MKNLHKILFVVVVLLFGACGTNIEDDRANKIYDMWEYMTPPHSIDVEYNEYTNGQKTDYFHETTKVFRDSVERESGDELIRLTSYESYIRVEESNGNIVTVQRDIKIGDSNIFNSSINQSCRADDYFLSIIIKGYEFFNVIKVACRMGSGSTTDIYYGYNEGIVVIDRVLDGTRTEIVKVYERRLQ
jgi:hypothetical protein